MQFDISKIKLIAGLGNFEPKYDNTRHNAGYILVDLLREQFDGTEWRSDSKNESEFCKVILPKAANEEGEIDGQVVLLVKPTTGMNLSGRAVQKILHYYRIRPSELLLTYDDLDLELGKWKLQFNRYPKVHNGVNSVLQSLGGEKFWHLRLGIDNRQAKGQHAVSGMRYALERFTEEEKIDILDEAQEFIDLSFKV